LSKWLDELLEVREDRDWVGNKASIFATLAATSHSRTGERQKHDYYATEPRAAELLLEVERFDKNILEPACGEGHISKVLISHDYNVTSHDLIDRGYGEGGRDFLKRTEKFNGDIITNPPYKYAQRFIEKSLELIPKGNKVAMFLKVQFLEGQARKKMFAKYPPKVIYVSSSRLNCAKNGDFEKYTSSAVAYAWFVWVKGFKGDPIIKWIN